MMNDLADAVKSIYSFISRTAEKTEDGYRWCTMDYSDNPQYCYNVFNGVGGIPFFLRDYYRLSGDSRALDLAKGAVDWCTRFKNRKEDFDRGMQLGKTGVAYAALYLANAEASELPDFCEVHARKLLAEPVGPVTDFLSGEASNGWYLIKLWQETENELYLNGAVRCARWISDNLIRNKMGTYCLVRPDGEWFGATPYSGLSHGIAGVAHFFVFLYEATHDQEWRGIAIELLHTLIENTVPIYEGLNWPVKLGGNELSRCQHSHGAAGIGVVFAKASSVLDDSSFLDVAIKSGTSTYHYGDSRSNPTLCTGLAGSGELFVELYNLTSNELWWDRAKEFARLAISYKDSKEDGDYWPTDTSCLYSADFTYGASGTGHFLLRTLYPSKFSMPLF